MEEGVDPPATVWEALSLWPVGLPYLDAFRLLDRSRDWVPGGMGPAMPRALAVSEIITYGRAVALAVTPDEVELAVRLIGALDAAWMTHHFTTSGDGR